MLPHLLVRGMHGLGDNLHQRAVLRELMKKNKVWLLSSWVSLYHDLNDDGLNIIRTSTALRTQSKNAERESNLFASNGVPCGARELKVWYTPAEIRTHGSILGAMMKSAGCESKSADFGLPIPQLWSDRADDWLKHWGNPKKPLMIYRPLVDRTEWRGCTARNPDFKAYAELYNSIRERFFVVSVADLVPAREWMVGIDVQTDAKCHAGELNFEVLAALTKRAALLFCSPGFAVILAQAVGTPAVCVFGGHESSMTISLGSRLSPTLGIDPINPCDCFSIKHSCDKRIDLARAQSRLEMFIHDFAHHFPVGNRHQTNQLAGSVAPVHEPRGIGISDRSGAQRLQP